MRCKKHFNDFSSHTGVCASCLREHLFVLIIAQNEYNQAQKQDCRLDATDINDDDLFPVVFPRSVSPDYVSCRQSDCGIDGKLDCPSLANQSFYSTPQIGPNGELSMGAEGRFYWKMKNGIQISWFSHLFRSKSEKHGMGVSDPCRTADTVDTGSNSRRNSFWFGKMFSSRRSTIRMDQSTAKENRGVSNKGVSPARFSFEEDEQWNHRSSGSSSECSMPWNKMPKRTPAWVAPGRQGGNGKSVHSRNATGFGFGFCWSPLVRASPSQHWNQKGVLTEAIISGVMPVVPVKPPPCNAVVALCKNRSRKLADFGRFRHNR